MKRILVDIDDTLVLYRSGGIHPYGFLYGYPFEPNKELIDRLKKFDGEIIVWSGGGAEYANKVAKMLLPRDMKFTAKAKGSNDIRNMGEGDVIVDDQPEYFISLRVLGVQVVSPFENWVTTTNKDIGEEA